MQFLTNLIGDNKPLLYLAIAVLILVVVLLLIAGYRLLFGPRIRSAGGGRARQPRLGVVDAYDLDRQRQLVLVRRDNVEHLIMIGGPNDLLIEQAIIRGQPAVPAPAPTARDVTPPVATIVEEPVMAPAPVAVQPTVAIQQPQPPVAPSPVSQNQYQAPARPAEPMARAPDLGPIEMDEPVPPMPGPTIQVSPAASVPASSPAVQPPAARPPLPPRPSPRPIPPIPRANPRPNIPPPPPKIDIPPPPPPEPVLAPEPLLAPEAVSAPEPVIAPEPVAPPQVVIESSMPEAPPAPVVELPPVRTASGPSTMAADPLDALEQEMARLLNRPPPNKN